MFQTSNWPLQREDSFCGIWASETIVLSEDFDPRAPDLPGRDAEELGRRYVAGAMAMHGKRRRFRLRNPNIPDAEQDERVTRAIEVGIGPTQGVPVVRALLRLPWRVNPTGTASLAHSRSRLPTPPG